MIRPIPNSPYFDVVRHSHGIPVIRAAYCTKTDALIFDAALEPPQRLVRFALWLYKIFPFLP